MVPLGFLFASITFFISCKKQRQPNIILITVDDLGWTDLGCYGSTFYETPNIDKLAREGFRFTNAYAAAAICSPTRAAIMTGQYPARIGITDWIRARFQGGGEQNREGFEDFPDKNLLTPYNPYHLDIEETTIPELLKTEGYVSGFIGKWHLGTEAWFPEKQGFDMNKGGCDYGQPPSYFDPYISLPNRWRKDTLKGFPNLNPRMDDEYLTDREAAEAIDFIRENKNKKFFLNLCHYAVHTPIQGKADIITKYKNKKATNHKSVVYAAMVESVDEALGQILKTLKELGLNDETMIIFTSDNGGLLTDIATDNSPLRSGKGYPYEGGIRIPTIVNWKNRIEPGSITDQPIISMDLLPTICSAAGVNIPEDLTIDGNNLMPLLLDGEALQERSLYWHFPHYRERDVVPYNIVRKNKWKLIHRYEEREIELYDLEADLSETKDLSQSHPEVVKALYDDLTKWLTKVDAKIPREKEDTQVVNIE
jgi:arylsulfatase A-like enzyme